MFDIARYMPPGPVAAAFIRDDASTVPTIMGPVGSGKTNAVIFKILRYVATMPAMNDGVVRAKCAVIRQDYRTLYRTTLSSWHRWFPKDYPGSEYTGGADRPATHIVRFKTPRGRRIELTMEFQALGDKRIEDILRGWEGTLAWLNEIDLLDESALDFLLQRLPRWPAKADMEFEADLPRRIFGDLNPPGNPKHWVVKRFIGAVVDGARVPPTEGFKLYRQPSGLSPQAENIKNLAAGYYEGLAKTLASKPWELQRMVHGKIGYDRSGMPVYPEFDETVNVSAVPLHPIAGLPIAIGLDGALHPAAVIVQRAPNLQKRVLEELYFGRMGPTRFAAALVAALNDRYPTNPVTAAYYDPSADYGADKEGGEQSWVDIVGCVVRKAGIPFPMLPAPSNEPTLRQEAVRNGLLLPIDANNRELIVSPDRCPMLIEGFMSDYRYKLNPDGTLHNRDDPRPEKNDHANPHDALQYVCLGMDGRAGAIAAAAKKSGSTKNVRAGNTVAKTDFTV